MDEDVKGSTTIILCGDLNIDLLKFDSHCGTKNFVDAIYSLGLYPTIDKPSRITAHSATLVDNIYTNDLQGNIKGGLLISDISDHLPVFTVLNTSVTDRVEQNLNL